MSETINIQSALSYARGILFGTKDGDPTKGETVDVVNGAAKVATLSEVPGDLITYEYANVSSTRQSFVIGGEGASAIELLFLDLGSSNQPVLRVVLNALSDADANAKLSAVGARIPVPRGVPFRQVVAVAADNITRIDFLTPSAETGSNLLIIHGRT